MRTAFRVLAALIGSGAGIFGVVALTLDYVGGATLVRALGQSSGKAQFLGFLASVPLPYIILSLVFAIVLLAWPSMARAIAEHDASPKTFSEELRRMAKDLRKRGNRYGERPTAEQEHRMIMAYARQASGHVSALYDRMEALLGPQNPERLAFWGITKRDDFFDMADACDRVANKVNPNDSPTGYKKPGVLSRIRDERSRKRQMKKLRESVEQNEI